MGLQTDKLKQLRLSKGLLQKDVAKALEISVQAYSLYEKGLREPNLDTIEKLAHYFGITPDSLLGWTNKEPTISEEIIRVRTKKRISLEELSKLSTIPLEKLKEFEEGTRVPLNADFLKLAYVLDRDGKENFGQVPFILFLPDDEFPETENVVGKIYDNLTLEENKLIYDFRQLNIMGQKEASKRIEELTEIVKYRK